MEKDKLTLTVKVGSNVVFDWEGYHNVWLMPNKADYDACNFKSSKELAKNKDKPFTFKASDPGVYYFGCEVGAGFHCNTPQKLALTVIGMLCALATQRSNSFHAYDRLSRDIFFARVASLCRSRVGATFANNFLHHKKYNFRLTLHSKQFYALSQKVSPRRRSQRTTVRKARALRKVIQQPTMKSRCTILCLSRQFYIYLYCHSPAVRHCIALHIDQMGQRICSARGLVRGYVLCCMRRRG